MTSRLALGKEFGDPDVEHVPVAMKGKKLLDRNIVQHPTRLPSSVLLQELEDIAELAKASGRTFESQLASLTTVPDSELGADLTQHPAYLQAIRDGLSLERILPMQAYIDGVAYTNNESFLVFTITFMRTGRQHVLWSMRTLIRLHI